jgi:hypothetical protein
MHTGTDRRALRQRSSPTVPPAGFGRRWQARERAPRCGAAGWWDQPGFAVAVSPVPIRAATAASIQRAMRTTVRFWKPGPQPHLAAVQLPEAGR